MIVMIKRILPSRGRLCKEIVTGPTVLASAAAPGKRRHASDAGSDDDSASQAKRINAGVMGAAMSTQGRAEQMGDGAQHAPDTRARADAVVLVPR